MPDPRRDALLQNIVKKTQAEYDWPSHVTLSVRSALKDIQEKELKSRLEQFLNQVRQPEDLLFFGPAESERILYERGLEISHSVFGTFRSLFSQISNLVPYLENSLRQDLQSLKSFYESYINALCRCEGDIHQIGHLLDKKVLLKTEKMSGSSETSSLTSPVFYTPSSASGVYRISQEMARQLISKDCYGFVDRKNKTGLRAVQSHGGVHFKLLESSLDDPRPGIEYMAYAFSKALTDEFLVTPSTLIKLEGIPLFDPTENFPPQLSQAKREGKDLKKALAELNLDGGWKNHVKLKHHDYFCKQPKLLVLKTSPKPSRKIQTFKEILLT